MKIGRGEVLINNVVQEMLKSKECQKRIGGEKEEERKG